MIVHARSEQHARELRAAIASRLAECGLELNEHKTRIVYCKDGTGAALMSTSAFDFLGYTFRPRLARSKAGGQFVNFLPAVSDDARKRCGREIRRWRLHRVVGQDPRGPGADRSTRSCRGGSTTTGASTARELVRLLKRINEYLVRWARWKYKRLRRHPAKARRFLADVYRRQPGLFAHWRFGARPDGWTMGAG